MLIKEINLSSSFESKYGLVLPLTIWPCPNILCLQRRMSFYYPSAIIIAPLGYPCCLHDSYALGVLVDF